MRPKRKKAARIKLAKEPPPPDSEKCWYCALDAVAGAEVKIRLSKPDGDFDYFESDSENIKYLYRDVRIGRCIRCKTAHENVESVFNLAVFYCLAGCITVGVLIAVYQKTITDWITVIIWITIVAIVGAMAVGINYNFFMLPDNIKAIDDVKKEKQIQALKSDGWRITIKSFD